MGSNLISLNRGRVLMRGGGEILQRGQVVSRNDRRTRSSAVLLAKKVGRGKRISAQNVQLLMETTGLVITFL